jgi:hypothetical protein
MRPSTWGGYGANDVVGDCRFVARGRAHRADGSTLTSFGAARSGRRAPAPAGGREIGGVCCGRKARLIPSTKKDPARGAGSRFSLGDATPEEGSGTWHSDHGKVPRLIDGTAVSAERALRVSVGAFRGVILQPPNSAIVARLPDRTGHSQAVTLTPGRISMVAPAYLAELVQLSEAFQHPSVDGLTLAELKRRKLQLKDEMARLARMECDNMPEVC